MSTILSCDKIIVLEDGKIAEMGSHEELLARKGKYYNLWKSQTLEAREVEEEVS